MANISARHVTDIYAEGLRYFMGEGTLNKTLARLSRDLEEHGIDTRSSVQSLCWRMAILGLLRILIS